MLFYSSPQLKKQIQIVLFSFLRLRLLQINQCPSMFCNESEVDAYVKRGVVSQSLELMKIVRPIARDKKGPFARLSFWRVSCFALQPHFWRKVHKVLSFDLFIGNAEDDPNADRIDGFDDGILEYSWVRLPPAEKS